MCHFLCDWTITKNPLNSSCCCLSLPPSVSEPSPPGSLPDAGGTGLPIFQLSNSLLSFCQIEQRGILSQLSLHARPHISLISPGDRGGSAWEINALHLHFLSHFCLTSKVTAANKPLEQYLCEIYRKGDLVNLPLAVQISLRMSLRLDFYKRWKCTGWSSPLQRDVIFWEIPLLPFIFLHNRISFEQV